MQVPKGGDDRGGCNGEIGPRGRCVRRKPHHVLGGGNLGFYRADDVQGLVGIGEAGGAAEVGLIDPNQGKRNPFVGPTA